MRRLSSASHELELASMLADDAPPDFSKRWSNQFAKPCSDVGTYNLAIVDTSDGMQHAEKLFKKVQMFMNETEKTKWQLKKYASAEDLEKEESSVFEDAAPHKINCFAIQLDKFDVVEKDFEVTIRYSPTFLKEDLAQDNLIKSEKTLYNDDYYDNMFNISYFEVMSAVSDYIIDVAPKQPNFANKDLSYQLNFDTSFRRAYH